MKILYFVHTFEEQNGISIHLMNLANNLPKNISYKIISGKGEGLPFFSSLRIPSIAQILEALMEDFEIIHIHGYGNLYSFFGALIAFLKRKPLVWTIHGYPQIAGFRRIFYYFYRYLLAPFIYAKAKRLISVSYSAIDFIKKETARPIEVIPNGIDCNLFKPYDNYRKAKNICFVGRLDKDKQAEKLLECYSHPILYIGSNEGKTRENIISKAKLLGRKVTFRQFDYFHMPKAYQKCRYVILPSKYEGFPLVMLEAIACGRPFLCTNVGENRKVLSYLFNNPDRFIINQQIDQKIKLLERKDLTVELKKARKKLAFYSWKKVAQETAKVYSQARG